MHSSGRSSAACANRFSAASATKNDSGGSPDARPSATLSACRCGSTSASRHDSSGVHKSCNPAKASSISDSTPTQRATVKPTARSVRYRSSAVLPIPGSPRTTKTALRPPRTRSNSPSSVAHSRCRPHNDVNGPPSRWRSPTSNHRPHPTKPPLIPNLKAKHLLAGHVKWLAMCLDANCSGTVFHSREQGKSY